MKRTLRRIREGYFSFRGRLPRKIFWLRMLVLYMAMQVLAGAVAYGVPALGFSEQATLYASLAMTFLFWVGSASLWVRRFHDRNVSGWWYAAFFAFILGVFAYLVYAVALTGGEASSPDMVLAKYLIIAALMAWLFVAVRFGFRRGTPGPNRYGPDPLGMTAELPGEIRIS